MLRYIFYGKCQNKFYLVLTYVQTILSYFMLWIGAEKLELEDVNDIVLHIFILNFMVLVLCYAG